MRMEGKAVDEGEVVAAVEGEGEEEKEEMIIEATEYSLPDELWLLVFQFLKFAPNLASVCKRWNDIYVNNFRLTSFVPKTQNDRLLRGLTSLIEKYGRNPVQLFSDKIVENVFIAALQNGGPAMLVKEMLTKDKRINPARHDNLAIRTACCSGSAEIVSMLLEDERVDPSTNENLPLCSACANGRSEVVKVLLKAKKVNPTVHGQYPVRIACELGYSEVVQLLLADKRVDPSAEMNYAMTSAISNNRAKVVEVLLKDPRINPASDNNFAIRWSCSAGFTEIVRLLLKNPAKVDPTAGDNYAYRKARARGYSEIEKLLLNDPRVRNYVNNL